MITVTLLSISFLLAISLKIKHYRDRHLATICWYVHLFFAVLSGICFLLFCNGYVFKGIHTDRIIYSLYAGSGMILYALMEDKVSGRRGYLSVFFALPFILLGALILPPLRIYAVVAGIWLLVDGEFKRYPVDDHYALQTRTTAVINSQYPTYSLVQNKYWLLEKITDDVITPRQAAYSIQGTRIKPDSIQLRIFTDRKEIDTTIGVY